MILVIAKQNLSSQKMTVRKQDEESNWNQFVKLPVVFCNFYNFYPSSNEKNGLLAGL